VTNDTQLLKGLLEGCILKILSRQESYGYQIVELLLSAGIETNEATVYPILARLQKQNALRVVKRPSSLGPDRKYYFLTEAGEAALTDFYATWTQISAAVGGILED